MDKIEQREKRSNMIFMLTSLILVIGLSGYRVIAYFPRGD